MAGVRTRALTASRPIKPTSPRCHSAWQPNPGRGSTYRCGKSVQTTGTTSVTSPGGDAVNLANTTGSIATIGTSATLSANVTTANPITITNTSSSGTNNTGLRIQTSGSATITATNTTIDVRGTASEDAILAIVQGGAGNPVASVTYNQGTGLGLSSSGPNSTVIQA